ncbi:MAG: hypothetical protein ABSD08_08615 [Xanthobacteraceae bacterium]
MAIDADQSGLQSRSHDFLRRFGLRIKARRRPGFFAGSDSIETRALQPLHPIAPADREAGASGASSGLQFVTVRLEFHSKRRELATSSRIDVTLPASQFGLLSVCWRCRGLSGRDNEYRGSEKQCGGRAAGYPSENRGRFQPIRDMVH